MATKSRSHSLDSRQTSIPILQVVDTIRLDFDELEGIRPIEAAFRSCGEFLADSLAGPQERAIHLEFAWEGMEFQASYVGNPQRPLDQMD